MRLKKNAQWPVVWILPLLLMSCIVTPEDRFDRAVADAAVVEEKDIHNGLVAVTPGNPDLVWDESKTRVLVVMWKSKKNFDDFYKGKTRTDPSEAYLTWVTTAPEVQAFGKGYLKRYPLASADEVILRLKQYLGLKPEWTYDLFVEMWVKPEDMFRPCTDPEIDDTVCNIGFSDPEPRIRGIPCYSCFYKNLYFEDFRTRPGIPWTGMGYTYDWGSPIAPFGASEFILVPGAEYEIVRVANTMAYLREGSP